jgi:hypothetical protein
VRSRPARPRQPSTHQFRCRAARWTLRRPPWRSMRSRPTRRRRRRHRCRFRPLRRWTSERTQRHGWRRRKHGLRAWTTSTSLARPFERRYGRRFSLAHPSHFPQRQPLTRVLPRPGQRARHQLLRLPRYRQPRPHAPSRLRSIAQSRLRSCATPCTRWEAKSTSAPPSSDGCAPMGR